MTIEEEEVESCRTAMKSALETMQNCLIRCGTTPEAEVPAPVAVKKAFGVPYGERTVMLRGRYEVPIPADIEECAHDQEVPRDDRITNIKKSAWSRNVVKGICSEVIGATGGMVGRQEERQYTTEQLSKELADKVVGW